MNATATTTRNSAAATSTTRSPKVAKVTAKPAAATPAAAKTPEAPKVSKAPGTCKCGCGQRNVRAEALYLSGHDARHAGQVGRAIIADPTKADALLATLPTPALKVKAQGMVNTAQAKAAAKVAAAKAREAAKAAAKAAYDAEIAKA